MDKRNYGGMNVGTSSVLVAFVLVCLVTFAGLSFLSANSDYTLSKESATRTTEYYKANEQAEYKLAEIDRILTDSAKNVSDETSYYKSIDTVFSDSKDITVSDSDSTYLTDSDAEKRFISYTIDINEKQQLYVTLLANYPHEGNYCTYNIVKWNTGINPNWSDDSESFGDKLMF